MKKQNKCCIIIMVGADGFLQHSAALVRREMRPPYLCLQNFAICGKVYCVVSHYESLGRAGFFLPSMCRRITLIFFFYEKR